MARVKPLEKEAVNGSPPKNVWEWQREGVAKPAADLTPKQLAEWTSYFGYIARRLREETANVEKREQDARDRAWRWVNLIVGLKQTIELQAQQLGGGNFPLIQEKVRKLLRFSPDWLPVAVRKELEKGEKTMPFFTESFLYETIGKEDARSLLAIVGNLAEIVGVDPDDVHNVEDEGTKRTWDEIETELRNRRG